MKLNFFRELNETEEKEFRQWARDNYAPGETASEVWHPVVRDEWEKIAANMKKNREKINKEYKAYLIEQGKIDFNG
jgi:hypothetical protein